MSLALDIIRDKIASEVAPADIGLVSGMIADKLGSNADMAAITSGIAAARTEFAVLFKPDETKKPAAESNLPVGFRAPPDRAENRTKIATTGGNPWMPATINLTHQVLLEANDPDLAAQMKAEAGAR